ncbi:MAG: MATE family efflux transporter [Faecousia sp.]
MEQHRLFPNQKLIRLIIPLVIEQGLTILVGMCDGVMVSSVGEAAISGVSLVDMINNVVLTLFAALATGGAVVTSQYLGARQMDNARRSIGQLVIMSAVFGLAAMGLCLVLGRGMMRLFFGSIEADVMEAGLLYFRITALSFPFIALYHAGAAIFRSVGNSKVSMKVSILMNIVNVGGNALCIYGLKMGVAGVAVPTLVSRAVAAVVILSLAAQPNQELYLQGRNLRPIQRNMMKNILHIGIPSAFENSLFQLGRVVVVSMIALFGTYQTSANAVANNLDSMGVLIGQAMSLSMITVVGQCVGAGEMDEAIYNIKKLMLWCYLAQGLTNALILFFLPQLVGLYSSLSPETEALSIRLVQIHAGCAIALWPASFVLPNALRASNDVRFTMVVSVFSMVFWRIGFSWLLCVQMGYGAVGVWIAMVIDWVFRVTFFVGRMLSGKWKSKYVPA